MRRCDNCHWSWYNGCEDNGHCCAICDMNNNDAGVCKCNEINSDTGLMNMDDPAKCPYYEKYEKEI